MKKLLLIPALALALTGFGVSAQNTSTDPNTSDVSCGYGHGGGHRGGGHMMRDLNLTDAQKTQLRALMEQERIDHQAKVRALLTPEQQAIYDARISQRNAHHNSGH